MNCFAKIGAYVCHLVKVTVKCNKRVGHKKLNGESLQPQEVLRHKVRNEKENISHMGSVQ